MALNIVAIRTAAEDLVATALGASYKELPFQYDVESNDARSLAAGYAVSLGDAAQVYTIDQLVNIEQDLFVDVTKRVYIRNDDDKMSDAIDTIYNALEQIIVGFCLDKIALRNIIQKVELSSMSEPTRIGEGRDIVRIRLSFKIKYLI